MITAHQSARFRAVTALVEAREQLVQIRSLVCFDTDEVRSIDIVVDQIDKLFDEILPK